MTSVSIEERIELCRRCLDLLVRHADTWTHLASTAKGLGPDSPFLAEDILTGPAVVARQLRLTIQTLTSLQQRGSVLLPGSVSRDADGRVTVPVFPTTGHFDTLTFMGLRGTVRMLPHVTPEDVHGSLGDTAATGRFERTCLVLGAGNVSSIPATDALNKILFECRRVILKMNPVNEYLAPVFRDIFAPLIEKELLKIVTGGVAESAALTEDPSVDEIHITGAAETHDAIVWGPTPEERTQRRSAGTPRISKPVTSELGNVTPWIIVPGEYSRSQLDSQAQHVAASITNNASFNCLATKIILTWDRWPQRGEFLSLLRHYLSSTPTRRAYYPGAAERFERFAGVPTAAHDDLKLPWTLLTGQKIEERPDLFEQESFVCVCAESSLTARDPIDFLNVAASFANDRVTGTLCATVTMPSAFRKRYRETVRQCLNRLRYGSVCINQWAGLAYGLISPPWGAFAGATVENVHSGIGHVHNTCLLDGIEKTVLEGPLINFPKPIWFPSHRRGIEVAKGLVALYHQPSPAHLPRLFFSALTG